MVRDSVVASTGADCTDASSEHGERCCESCDCRVGVGCEAMAMVRAWACHAESSRYACRDVLALAAAACCCSNSRRLVVESDGPSPVAASMLARRLFTAPAVNPALAFAALRGLLLAPTEAAAANCCRFCDEMDEANWCRLALLPMACAVSCAVRSCVDGKDDASCARFCDDRLCASCAAARFCEDMDVASWAKFCEETLWASCCRLWCDEYACESCCRSCTDGTGCPSCPSC